MKAVNRCALFVLLAGITGCGMAGCGSTVRIAEDGRPMAVIAVPDKPGDTEEFAASELQSYLKKITGAELPIISERELGEHGNMQFISVGLTRLSERTRERLAGEPADAFVVESVPNGIVLAGGGESGRSPGTLFAVYNFLERDLGCRWLGPGELWEHVPSKPVLSVRPDSRLERPAFRYRSCNAFSDDHHWSLKNLANMGQNHAFLFDWFPSRLAARRGPPFDVPGYLNRHSAPGIFLPFSRRVEDECRRRTKLAEHSEWIALREDGSRDPIWLCQANPELNDLLADRFSQMLREKPHMDFVQLGEADGFGSTACLCRACGRLAAPGAGARESFRGENSYRRIIWINTVAAMLAETDPDKLLLGTAHNSCQEPPPPDLVRPAENVMMDYATRANCRAHGYEHAFEDAERLPECESHERGRAWIEQWSEMTPAGLFVWEWHIRGTMSRIAAPQPRRFIRDMRYLHKHGFTGYTIAGPTVWSFCTINSYALLKAAWTPGLDEDELVREFCDHAFHEGSEPMQAFITVIEEAVNNSGCCHSRLVAWTTDRERMDKARRNMDKARAAVADHEVARQRLVSWDIHFQYADLAGPAIHQIVGMLHDVYGVERDADTLRSALERLQEAADYAENTRNELIQQYGAEVLNRPDMRVIRSIGTRDTTMRALNPNSPARLLLAELESE